MEELSYISANKVLFWLVSLEKKEVTLNRILFEVWKDSPNKRKEYSPALNKSVVQYGEIEGFLKFFVTLPGEDRKKLLTFVFSNYFLERPL